MLNFDEMYQKVKDTLSEKRFYHSVCVMEKCEELAKLYGEDIEKAKIAGIMHDIAKEIPKQERIEIAEEYDVVLDEIEKNNTGLIHAKLGAKICEKDFKLEEDICNAIKYHTTGKENMTMLEKIVYISDAIGNDRTYENTDFLRNLAYENIDRAVIELLKYTIEDRLKENKMVHLDSIKAFNYLIKNI